MCILCFHVEKKSLTPKEFWRNYREMDIPDDHIIEVVKAVATTDKEYQDAINEAAFDEDTFVTK